MDSTEHKKIYECGTLKYTRGSLILTVVLIMLGFFCFVISTSAVGNMVPIHLRNLGASNTAIAIIISTIGGVLNMTICPTVSFKSDRYRGKRWGRRIYFIISTLPMYCVSMLLFAGADKAGEWLSSAFSSFTSVSTAAVTIVLLGIIMAMYKFFYMYVGSVIYYIYNDIIPSQFLARVVGMTNVATAAGSAFFSFFLFKYTETHFSLVMVICTVIYAVMMTAVCFLIKEPVYPPLTEEEKKQSRGSRGILTFMKESFSHSFYLNSFVGAALVATGFGMMTYVVFLHQNIGMDLGGIGNMNGTSGLIGVAISLSMAAVGTIFVDRWHPTRIYVFATCMTLLIPFLRCRLNFISPTPEMYFIIYLMENFVYMLASGVVAISSLPALMRMFPKSRFGQFCSARALLVSLTGLLMGFLLGVVIDMISKKFGMSDRAYRLLWFWYTIFVALGSFFLLKMFCQWKRAGGENGFNAPAPWSPEGYEKLSSSEVEGVSVKQLKIGFVIMDILCLLYAAGAVAAFFFCRSYGHTTAAESYFNCALIPAIALGALYLMWRLSILRDMKKFAAGKLHGMLHHGILFISILYLLILAAITFIETKMVISGDPEHAGRYYLAHTATAGLLIIILAVSNMIEKRTTTAVKNTECSAELPAER